MRSCAPYSRKNGGEVGRPCGRWRERLGVASIEREADRQARRNSMGTRWDLIPRFRLHYTTVTPGGGGKLELGEGTAQ